jgi:hypothetical protein
MPAIVTETFRKKLAQDLLTEINNAADSNEYYIGIGKSDAYNATDTTVNPIRCYREEREARNNLQSVKKVINASFVIPRYNWTSGTVYSGFDDAVAGIPTNTYYVLTEDNQVYICLQQSKNATGQANVSTVKPDFAVAGVDEGQAFITADGYTWKFLYSLSATAAANFLSAGYIPVEKVIWNTSGDSTDLSPFQLEQLIVQQSAVSGQILNITLTSGGSGYTSAPTVTITGNGTSAAATATISGGSVVKIAMNNESAALGSGYDYADVAITGGGGSGATARIVLGPKYGVGADPREELKATSLMFNVKPAGTENGDFIVNNDFRQITVLRNIEQYNSNTRFTASTGRAMSYMKTTTLASSFTIDKLLVGATSGAKAYIDDIQDSAIYYHQNENTGFATFVDGEALSESDGSGTGTADSANLHGIVDNFSGEMLYVENRARVIRSTSQTEDIKVIITA